MHITQTDIFVAFIAFLVALVIIYLIHRITQDKTNTTIGSIILAFVVCLLLWLLERFNILSSDSWWIRFLAGWGAAQGLYKLLTAKPSGII